MGHVITSFVLHLGSHATSSMGVVESAKKLELSPLLKKIVTRDEPYVCT